MVNRVATILFWSLATFGAAWLLWLRYRPRDDVMVADNSDLLPKFLYFGLPIATFIGFLLYLTKRRPK